MSGERRLTAYRWATSGKGNAARTAGVGIYEVGGDDDTLTQVMAVELTPAEMIDLATDLLGTAREMAS